MTDEQIWEQVADDLKTMMAVQLVNTLQYVSREGDTFTVSTVSRHVHGILTLRLKERVKKSIDYATNGEYTQKEYELKIILTDLPPPPPRPALQKPEPSPDSSIHTYQLSLPSIQSLKENWVKCPMYILDVIVPFAAPPTTAFVFAVLRNTIGKRKLTRGGGYETWWMNVSRPTIMKHTGIRSTLTVGRAINQARANGWVRQRPSKVSNKSFDYAIRFEEDPIDEMTPEFIREWAIPDLEMVKQQMLALGRWEGYW